MVRSQHTRYWKVASVYVEGPQKGGRVRSKIGRNKLHHGDNGSWSRPRDMSCARRNVRVESESNGRGPTSRGAMFCRVQTIVCSTTQYRHPSLIHQEMTDNQLAKLIVMLSSTTRKTKSSNHRPPTARRKKAIRLQVPSCH
jgi:hypothetical protein